MKKNTGYDITARFERSGDKFVVKYKRPSEWSFLWPDDLEPFEETFDSCVKAIKFMDLLKIDAEFWNGTFTAIGLHGEEMVRYAKKRRAA